MFNIKINPKYNRIIVIFIAIIISLLILFIIILPTLKKIKQMTQNIYSQRVALEKLYLRGQSIRETKENYEKVKDDVKELEKVFNHLGQELDFITALEKIAEEKNISQIINIKNGEKEPSNEDYISIEVAVNLSGNYNDLIRYLTAVQNLDFYFNINYLDFYYPSSKTFTLTGKANDSEKIFEKSNNHPVVNLTLSGITYWK
ncbi:hypothetical protein L6278_00230 [Candidatus Parcubacteria bacterium]|nr:hypothetical protein [Patescibacteria group bacterium]MBU4482170.1 hypothetical protein [Patescibacteria group bacterium]MCG2686546.1 hypothetical protein [Candidatus Parcubacteria bacterium]